MLINQNITNMLSIFKMIYRYSVILIKIPVYGNWQVSQNYMDMERVKKSQESWLVNTCQQSDSTCITKYEDLL